MQDLWRVPNGGKRSGRGPSNCIRTAGGLLIDPLRGQSMGAPHGAHLTGGPQKATVLEGIRRRVCEGVRGRKKLAGLLAGTILAPSFRAPARVTLRNALCCARTMERVWT